MARHLIRGLFAVALALASHRALASEGAAAAGCAPIPSAFYPPVDAPPIFTVAKGDADGPTLNARRCAGWTDDAGALLIGIAAKLRAAGGVDALLARVGAISTLSEVRYWSVREKQWNQLFTRAYAVIGSDGATPRADFSPAELRSGAEVRFVQADNRTDHRTIYRLRVISVSADRLVFEAENETTLRWTILPLFAPGQIRSAFFLADEAGEVWDYYGLLRVGGGAALVGTGHDASFVNRAVAIYRHIAGLPTDRDPPAVR